MNELGADSVTADEALEMLRPRKIQPKIKYPPLSEEALAQGFDEIRESLGLKERACTIKSSLYDTSVSNIADQTKRIKK